MKTFTAQAISLTMILLLTFMNANSQDKGRTYDQSWKRVEKFLADGLPKSALEEVKIVYTKAKKEKQNAQLIKALTYQLELEQRVSEKQDSNYVQQWEKEAAEVGDPAKSVINSLLAGYYWNYYQSHRYQFYNRTATTNFKKEDLATWTAEDFHERVTKLFETSISNKSILQKTKLEDFDAIINKGNARFLRPTLYDLLVFRALEYFQSGEADLNKPANKFEIDEASALEPAADFVQHKFKSQDTSSLQLKALYLYQDLLRFHLNDAKPDALIDADLARIQFTHANSVHPDKEEQYFNAINHIANQYADMPAASQAWYLVALTYSTKASLYKPYGDTTHRFDYLKAKEICERIIKQKENSQGKANAKNLLTAILNPSIGFSIEKVNIPDQPFRALVNYKSVNNLFLRIIPMTESIRKKMEEGYYNENLWTELIASAPIKKWQQIIPDTKDYQEHSVEIKVESLKVGEYILLLANGENLNDKKTIIGAKDFYVSGISYVNAKEKFFVLDRDNGQPLAAASVQVYQKYYDYQKSKYAFEKGELLKTDKNGYTELKKQSTEATSKRNYNVEYTFDIKTSKDRLYIRDAQNSYYYYRDGRPAAPTTNNSIFLFTDRSIYRPGQIVYFKGIAVSKKSDSKTSTVLSGYENTIYLRDVNGNDVQNIKVKTNDFGSFAGQFTLPESGLNGDFSLYTKTDGAFVSFKMEEYKRPKFFVSYEPVKGSYKVDDKITVTGTAKAYAGNNIDGAKVSYRVVRQPKFLYYWMFWRGWQPPMQSQEIAHGETVTAADGTFKIEFTALADRSIDSKLDPVFDYTISADITDINGETRSGQESVSVSYKALQIKSQLPETISTDSLKSFYIRTENINNVFESAKLKLTIQKLENEKRLIRERLWERPDQFITTKDQYIKDFPNDEFDNETDEKSWKVLDTVYEKSDTTKESGDFTIDKKNIPAGHYRVTLVTKDKNGQEIKDVKYIEITDEKLKGVERNDYLWTTNANSIQPGEKTKIQIGSAAENVFVIHYLNKTAGRADSITTNFSFYKLNRSKESFEFGATEADRGGYGAGWIFVKHGRVYQSQQTIYVPWSNKQLNIEYASFRDKTLPGSEEKWKLKISGLLQDKLASEVLVSMYDASLDQFNPHYWNTPYLYQTFGSRLNWEQGINFAKLESQEHRRDNDKYEYFELSYDQLKSPEYFGGRPGGGLMIRGMASEREKSMKVSDLAAAPMAESSRRTADSVPMYDVNDINKVTRYVVTQSDEMFIHGESGKKKPNVASDVTPRKNFNETAFFFPQLNTDANGAVEFSFTVPEALTKWKFQALAHTKVLAFGYSSKEIITQKDLMVQPNPTRFLREGDKMEFSTKVVNLSAKELTGTATFQLFDATTNEPVDGIFHNSVANQYFTVAAGASEAIKFPIDVPDHFTKAVTWRIVAKAGSYSDGEENSLPVLTNRMLVTESIPLAMRGAGTKSFQFQKLIDSEKSESLQQQGITVEYTSNPAWYAVQALPYLMEYPYECSEQTWNRYYANSLASYIAGSSKKIQQTFERWKIKDSAALVSNLAKNQELKSILLEETPWVMDAKDESEQKRKIGLLFDAIKMSASLSSSFEKLKQLQKPNGGFSWFSNDGPDNYYITQYIVTGIGHLIKLKGVANGQDANLKSVLNAAIPYLDQKIAEQYAALMKSSIDKKKYTPGYTEVQYLYMRSFFPEYAIPAGSKNAVTYYTQRATATWVQQNKYMQGMITLALFRGTDKKTPAAILRSLLESSVHNEEMGRYYKDNYRGWWWYEAPIERQALLIEAFAEAGNDLRTSDELKTWLLKNKQTNRWESTKATAEACYALLLQGTHWIAQEPNVSIALGKTKFNSDESAEAGTGYFTKKIEASKVVPSMGNISVTVENDAANKNSSLPSYGAVYWQYFEDLDKISSAETPLKLSKKLFIEKNTDRGPVLSPVNAETILKVGDKIKVRVELRADRDMEFVHLKDMRASSMEPVNVLSGYKWQDGLGYYETTRDASTNFFFDYVRKGTYVFEYPLFVSHTGNYSVGIATIQCMYAPEFNSHSEGIRVSVE